MKGNLKKRANKMNSALKELEDGEDRNFFIHINYEDTERTWEKGTNTEDRQRQAKKI